MPIIRIQIKPIGYLYMISTTSSQVIIFIILAGQAKPSSMQKHISIINMEVVATGAMSACWDNAISIVDIETQIH